MASIPTDRSVQDIAISGFRPQDLLKPSSFPHPVTQLRMRETHISWVILTGPFAYKIKKAVHLNFIDSTSLTQRQHLCEEELRLNHRLAPDLYLDIVSITNDVDGLHIDGKGPIVEYAVRMKQFDGSQELSTLLDHGEVTEREVSEFARDLGQFHMSAATAPCSSEFQHTQQLRNAVLGNLAVLLSHLETAKGLPAMGHLVDWTHDYLENSLVRLQMREHSGFVRECHGDLHARNIVRWQGRLTPFDCLEFDPNLRWIDVMNDVAFLVMDLAAHGRKDLAFAFLNTYLATTGDYEGVSLLSFYAVYRALIRAMVDSLEAERDTAHHDEFRRRLEMRVATAAQFVNRPTPTLIIMHGPSGSGKSWLSRQFIDQLEAVHVRSDLERKRLDNAHASDLREPGYEQGIYTSQVTYRTYARLIECAQNCLEGGVNTIVDATFLKIADRRMFHELATRQRVRYLIVSCTAERAILAQRIEKRRLARIDPSDADIDILDRQLQSMEPLDPGEQSHRVTVDTSQPDALSQALDAIRQRTEDRGR
jgi:uncharacterized protein